MAPTSTSAASSRRWAATRRTSGRQAHRGRRPGRRVQGGTEQEVNEVVVRGSRLYVGGAFTSVKSGSVTSTRSVLAALDTTSGAVLASVDVPFTGVYDPTTNDGGGTTNIARFDISPDGTKLVALGNFSTVGGLPRSQVAMLDVGGATASVSSWSTDRYDRAHNSCASVFCLRPRRRLLSRRLVLRRLGHRCVRRRRSGRHHVRHHLALGDQQHRERPDLDRLHRRRHHLRRRDHRRCGLRRRPHALAEQPLPG